MYKHLRRWALAILKTPPEPRPPIGDPASLRVFNAGRNYYRLRIFRWAVVQFFALAGIIFWTAFLINIEQSARTQAAERANRQSATALDKRRDNFQTRLRENIRAATTETVIGPDGKPIKKAKRYKGWDGFKQTFVELTLALPVGAVAVVWAVKLVSFLVYLVQLPISYAIRRLDYEMRWYMVTDRSLRLRHGVWQISESTMSFANIQQVVVSQGPLQRLLGLADVKVKSAGGGDTGGHHSHGDSDMHSGIFHSVTNAEEIRDLILDRLLRYREAGLGDPDEKSTHETHPPTTPGAFSPDTLTAAQELATEARALRAACS
jgi:membrane protein YdbS with pleckstrin-like domain